MVIKKRGGIHEIARLAGVSIATVSRVLNGKDNVDPVLSKRVLDVVEQLRYQPSPAARYMRSKKSGLLGIVVPKLSMAYFSDIVNGAIDKAREFGQLMIVANVEGSRSNERDFLKSLSQYMLDGLIYCPVATGEFIKKLHFLKQMPMVVTGRRKVLDGVPHISTDDEKAGYIATRYLLNMGRSAIGFFAAFWDDPPFSSNSVLIKAIDSPESGSFSTLDRLRGYRKALNESNLSIEEGKLVFSGFDAESGYKAAREIFGRLYALDALIVPNCYTAKGVYKFCEEQGIEIPKSLSLVSMDDLKTGELLSIPTTSIIHNMYQVGIESVIQINRKIDNKQTEEKLIDVKLLIRQSTTKKTDSE